MLSLMMTRAAAAKLARTGDLEAIKAALTALLADKASDPKPYKLKPSWEMWPAGWMQFSNWQSRSRNRNRAIETLRKAVKENR